MDRVTIYDQDGNVLGTVESAEWSQSDEGLAVVVTS